MTKYVFVTGGVVSSLGKGIAAASLAAILESRGIKVTNIKLDPTEQFLYVLGSQPSSTTPGNFLHVLNVSSVDGTLTETQTPIKLAVHTGEVPEGLAVVMK